MKPRTPTKLARIRVVAADRKRRALELRKEGKTFSQIGGELGVTLNRAYQYVRDGLAELNAKCPETAEEMRRAWALRLDAMLDAIWPKVLKGNLKAMDRALKISARASTLLGLDVAQKQAVASITNQILVYLPNKDGKDGTNGAGSSAGILEAAGRPAGAIPEVFG